MNLNQINKGIKEGIKGSGVFLLTEAHQYDKMPSCHV